MRTQPGFRYMTRAQAIGLIGAVSAERGASFERARGWAELWFRVRAMDPAASTSDDRAAAIPEFARVLLGEADQVRRAAHVNDAADVPLVVTAPALAPYQKIWIDVHGDEALQRLALGAAGRGWTRDLEVVARSAGALPPETWPCEAMTYASTLDEARGAAAWARALVSGGAQVAILAASDALVPALAIALDDCGIPYQSSFGEQLTTMAAVAPILDALRTVSASPYNAACDEHLEKLIEQLESSGARDRAMRAAVTMNDPRGPEAVDTAITVCREVARGFALVGKRVSFPLFANVAIAALRVHRLRPRFMPNPRSPDARVLILDAHRPPPVAVDEIALVGVSKSFFTEPQGTHAREAVVAAFGLPARRTAEARLATAYASAAGMSRGGVRLSSALVHHDKSLIPFLSAYVSYRTAPVPNWAQPPVDAHPHAHAAWTTVCQMERLRQDPFTESPYAGTLAGAARARAKEQLAFERRDISATQLNEYVTCPFRFFVHRVLDVPEPDRDDDDLGGDTIGIIVHEIVARFYQESPPPAIGETRDESWRVDARNRLMALAEEVLARDVPQSPYVARLRNDLFGCDDEPGLIDRFLDVERQIKTRPLFVEAAFGATDRGLSRLMRDAIPLCDAVGRVVARVGGIIDRVDSTPGGKGFVVYDYKTGSTERAVNKILEGRAFQLPLYVAAVQRALPDHIGVAAGLYSLGRPRQNDGFGPRDALRLTHPERAVATELGKGRARTGLRDDFDDIVSGYEVRAAELVMAMGEGRFPVGALSAKEMGCEWCAYRLACRYDATRALAIRTAPMAARAHVPYPRPFDESAIAARDSGEEP